MGGYLGDLFDWEILNQYGLFSKYRQAVNAQLDLVEQFLQESHAYCEIVEKTATAIPLALDGRLR